MGEYKEAFVGIDVAKQKNAIALAEGERGGEIRYLGEVDASDGNTGRLRLRRHTHQRSARARARRRHLPRAPDVFLFTNHLDESDLLF